MSVVAPAGDHRSSGADCDADTAANAALVAVEGEEAAASEGA